MTLSVSRTGILTKAGAVAAIMSVSLGLVACSDDDSSATSSSSATTTSSEAPAVALPTAAELNDVLLLAINTDAPIEDRMNTVQGGQAFPELFDVIAQARTDSGAELQVVDPVIPGETADTVMATVNIILPDQEPQMAENTSFVNEDGQWKLAQSWACLLIQNLAPDSVPEACIAVLNPQPAITGEAPADAAVPAEGELPAEEQAPVEGDAVAPAPVEEQLPAEEAVPAEDPAAVQ